MHKTFYSEIMKIRDLFVNLGVDVRIILILIKNWGVAMWIGFIWLWVGSGFREHGDERLSSIKDEEFIEYLC
jgi:hypothetical protein